MAETGSYIPDRESHRPKGAWNPDAGTIDDRGKQQVNSLLAVL
ncbi:hypothetical protein [Chelativorans sp. YIM 93263]|nr:hypothetical protein [Chelativorans sp. YIM 93263]